MKILQKLIALLLALCLLSCTVFAETPAQPETEPAAEETSSALPEAGEAAEPFADPEDPTEPTEPPTEAPTQPTIDKKAAAQACVGKDVSALYAAIGYPNSSSYASSCDGPGEDGELYYDGFTVYTYREDGKETVTFVY